MGESKHRPEALVEWVRGQVGRNYRSIKECTCRVRGLGEEDSKTMYTSVEQHDFSRKAYDIG